MKLDPKGTVEAVEHLEIRHIFNNPEKYSSCDKYPKGYRFSKFNTQKILR